MILADNYFKRNIKLLEDGGNWDENPRAKYADGTPAYSKYITQIVEEYNISKGKFPITTLRNTALKTGIKEIFWIYQQQSNKLEDAHKLGINWWDEFNIGNNTIGNRYGYTIKKYNLINNLLNNLIQFPFDRGHIINLFQYEDLNFSKGLRPCAYETIWSCRRVNGEMFLDLTLMQRSSDYLMAKVINSSQYVALQMMMAGHCNYKVGKFVHFIQNLHIYDRHLEALKEINNRIPLNVQPKIILKEDKNFYDYTIDDFSFENIENIPKLKNKLEIAI